ncbi:hypothetical protein N5C93_17140 [Pseudomonas nitroreducens]|uniref:hypothetical protein n=1 Tax=Pseudomonas nitroreducens TaxID=46680 RepID=UPI00244BD688|nr:hypothetical protein [Pseudomonas nitroreducens]MDH1074569.1 hypothetical protein [Pseudomonas nitroreducens]
MTTRPVPSLVDDQVADLIMPAGADIAAVLGLPRETLVQNLPRRMALTIKKGRKCLGVRR